MKTICRALLTGALSSGLLVLATPSAHARQGVEDVNTKLLTGHSKASVSSRKIASDSAPNPAAQSQQPSYANQKRRTLSLGEVLRLTNKISPDVMAGIAGEQQARESTEILKSQYYPTLDWGSLYTVGFPASSGSGLGVAGVIASPYRSGPATGVWSQYTVFSLTREYAIEESRRRRDSAEFRTKILRIRAGQEALQVYFDAARLRGNSESWEAIEFKIDKVVRIVDAFVEKGQHSVVSKLLIHDQLNDAKMRKADYWDRYEATLERLALLTGLNAKEIGTPLPEHMTEEMLKAIEPGKASPIIQRAEADVATARASINTSEAANYPVVNAVGAAGYMSKSRLVPEQNYAAGFSVTIPIFEGFRIQNTTHRAEAEAMQREAELQSAHLALDTTNARFDEIISSTRLKLEYLEQEHELALQAVELSKQRYLAFLGLLVDVRESIRNLIRIEMEMNQAKADLLFAMASKLLVNGGVVVAEK